VAANGRLSEEEILGGLGEILKISDPAKCL
jgi:hypothetical protein